jgi:methylphosphotriester-DNA--protein-cysteine methyltransferase
MKTFVKVILSYGLVLFINSSCSKKTTADTVVSSKKSNIFHSPSCKWAKEINNTNRETFGDANAAMAAGLKPCVVCRNQKSNVPTFQNEAVEKKQSKSTIRKFESLNE